jgi:hydroxymethylbilane synthase
VSHARTLACLRAERAAVRELAASCHTPVGIHAHDGTIRGFVGLPDGSTRAVSQSTAACRCPRKSPSSPSTSTAP